MRLRKNQKDADDLQANSNNRRQIQNDKLLSIFNFYDYYVWSM